MAAELGWFVTVADHRPGYLARGGFERAERAVLVEPEQLAAALPLEDFDAIVVMSHHLATDRKYLAELAGVDSRYLGVLGPRARRDRLLEELPDARRGFASGSKGPVGLDIGADSPESIALSILADLQVRTEDALVRRSSAGVVVHLDEEGANRGLGFRRRS